VLRAHLPGVVEAARPDLVFYLAGIDPLAGDRFGRLALTPAGLALRDACVLEEVRRRGLPVVLVLSGGYARTPETTALMHAIVHREARRVFG
jgi:acetoin utilization deacetylase AcuC-like enzyme